MRLQWVLLSLGLYHMNHLASEPLQLIGYDVLETTSNVPGEGSLNTFNVP